LTVVTPRADIARLNLAGPRRFRTFAVVFSGKLLFRHVTGCAVPPLRVSFDDGILWESGMASLEERVALPSSGQL
jgi:hypothetical protein